MRTLANDRRPVHETSGTVDLPVVKQPTDWRLRLILLAGGHVRQDFVTLLDVSSPAMLPYRGRPLIYVSVLNFMKLGGRDVLVVIPEGERRVEAFLRSSLGSRIHLTIVHAPSHPGASPLESLATALTASTNYAGADHPVLIAHGDIYWDLDSFCPGSDPILFTAPYIESDKYSTVHVTTSGIRFEEAWAGSKSARPHDDRSVARHTDIGLYYLPSAVEASRALGASPLPAATVGRFLFHHFGDRACLQPITSWIDLGHLDSSSRIRTQVLGTRECNQLEIDEMRGLITKRGRHRDKLLQEINYYHHLPQELSVYFPRLLESQLGKDVSYTIEYYGYKTLSEYLVFYEVPSAVWRQVLVKILAIHKAFASRSCQGPDPDRAFEFYWRKTEARLEEEDRSGGISTLLRAQELDINGKTYPGWAASRSTIKRLLKRVAATCTSTVIHGDLCCSNILYDPRTSLVKFIDPRGAFFDEGCYGDPRYDLAKLLHSFHGGYDFILHEMYELTPLSSRHYELSLLRSESACEAEHLLMHLLEGSAGYPLQDLVALEALLFLTMLPFHRDDPKRQTALYLRGLMLLQEAVRLETATARSATALVA